jgi:hypothetical protein
VSSCVPPPPPLLRAALQCVSAERERASTRFSGFTFVLRGAVHDPMPSDFRRRVCVEANAQLRSVVHRTRAQVHEVRTARREVAQSGPTPFAKQAPRVIGRLKLLKLGLPATPTKGRQGHQRPSAERASRHLATVPAMTSHGDPRLAFELVSTAPHKQLPVNEADMAPKIATER